MESFFFHNSIYLYSHDSLSHFLTCNISIQPELCCVSIALTLSLTLFYIIIKF
jgi:hypothetical protein